jgi:phosphoribosylaminoimidazole (AIR) synthetase
MGIGMALVVPGGEAKKILEELRLIKCDSCLIGKVIKGSRQIIIE